MIKKGIFFEVQVALVILILAFSEFAPVSENFAMIGFYTAFAISALSTIYHIYLDSKDGNYFSNSLLVGIASFILYYDGYWNMAIIVLSSNLILCSQKKFVFNLINQRVDKYRNQLDCECTAFSKGKEVRVHSSKLAMGNVFLVGEGELIPTDGMVFHGKSTVDESVFNTDGEIREVKEGSLVFAGTINTGGTLQIEAVSSQDDSYMGQLIKRLEGCILRNSETETNIKRILMGIKTVCLGLGLLFAIIPILSQAGTQDVNHKISVWILLFGTVDIFNDIFYCFCVRHIIKLNKEGISPKSVDSINKIKDVGILAIEKKESLAEGRYKLVSIEEEDGYSKEELLIYSAHAEAKSSHSISKAIMEAYLELIRYRKVDIKDAVKYEFIDKFEELSSMGVTAKVKGKFIFVGNDKLMKLVNIRGLKSDDDFTFVHVAIDGKYAGRLCLEYIVKEGIEEVNQALVEAGIRKYASVDRRDRKLMEELLSEKEKDEKLGLIITESSDMILTESQQLAILSIGSKDARKISNNRDLSFLSNDLKSAINFIQEQKKTNKRLKVYTGLVSCLKIGLYLVGFGMGMHISSIFTLDSLLNIGILLYSSK